MMRRAWSRKRWIRQLRKERKIRIVKLRRVYRRVPPSEKVFETNLDKRTAEKMFSLIQQYHNNQINRTQYYVLMRQQFGVGRTQAARLMSAVRTRKLFVKISNRFNLFIRYKASSPPAVLWASLNTSNQNIKYVKNSFEFQMYLLEELITMLEQRPQRQRIWGKGKSIRTPERDEVYWALMRDAGFLCDEGSMRVRDNFLREYVCAKIETSHAVLEVDPPKGFLDAFLKEWGE